MTGGTDGRTPVEQVVHTAKRWPAVTLGPHPFDGVEFHLDDYEFGHVHHGWESLHVNYPRRMRDALVDDGRTNEHPYFTNTGWTGRPLRTAGDVEDCLWLLRVSYLYRALTRREKPAGSAVLKAVDVPAELDDLGVSDPVRDVFEDVDEIGSLRRLTS